MSALPQGWTVCSVGELNYFEPNSVDPSKFPDESFDLYSVPAFPTARPERLKGSEIGSTKQLVSCGDVLICKINPRINRVWVVAEPTTFRQIASSEWIVVRSLLADPHYLRSYFSTPNFRSELESETVGVGGSLTRAQPSRVRTLGVTIAPTAEQHRIVAKLNTLLGRVDACRERLERVGPLIKRFRQSVLTAAVTGRLFDRSSTPSEQGWRTLRADVACVKVQSGGTPKGGFSSAGIPFLKVYNIVDQRIDFDYRPQYVTEDQHHGELRKSQTQAGDVLMNIVGPPLGKVAVVPATGDAWNINQALTLFRAGPEISPAWLHLVLLEGAPWRAVLDETKGSVGQVNISLSQCRAFEIPVPSPEQQRRTLKHTAALMAWADRIEDRLAPARQAVRQLTPATLDKAFRGELVPQDPNDEPASALLARLRAQREAAPANGNKAPGRRGRPRRAA